MGHINEKNPSCSGNKPFYVRAWRNVLEDWLSWPQQRIAQWMNAFDADLEDRGSAWFYHETAMHYMVPLLIRDRLDERLRTQQRSPERAIELHYFLEELEDAIGRGAIEWDENFDWKSAKKRVEEVLAKYGESFPNPDEVTAYELRMLKSRRNSSSSRTST